MTVNFTVQELCRTIRRCDKVKNIDFKHKKKLYLKDIVILGHPNYFSDESILIFF